MVNFLDLLKVHRVVFYSMPLIDQTDLATLQHEWERDLGVEFRRISVLNSPTITLDGLASTIVQAGRDCVESGGALLLLGIPSLLFKLEGLDYSFLVQLLVDLYDAAHQGKFYVLLVDDVFVGWNDRLGNIIPLYLPSPPALEEIRAFLTNCGWDMDLAETVRGLSLAEIKLALTTYSLGNYSDPRRFLMEFKIKRLQLLGLEFTPIPDVVDVGGMDILSAEIDRLPFMFSQVARSRGLVLPKGWLLVGPPGTGKTHVAKVTAYRLGWSMISIGVDKVQAGGVVEFRRILSLIDANQPCVAYFDELDKFFASDRADPQILGALLTWLQDKITEVFVLATLNRIDRVPPELTRVGRFDDLFYVGYPNFSGRRQIIKLYAARFDSRYSHQNDPFTLEQWYQLLTAVSAFNGSELRLLVDRAWELEVRASVEATEISFSALMSAARTIFPLYLRDTNRIIEIQLLCQQFARPVTSLQDDFAPPRLDLHGNSV